MSFSKSLYSKGYRYWMRRTLNGNFIDMVPYKAKRKPAGNGWVDITSALYSCCDKPTEFSTSPMTLNVTATGESFNILEGVSSPGGHNITVHNPTDGSTTNELFTYTISEDGTITVTLSLEDADATDTAAFILTDGYNYVSLLVTFVYIAS